VSYPLFLVKLLIRSGIARLLPAVRRWAGGGSAFWRYYSDRVLAAPHAQLRAAAPFLEAHGPDVIDLALGAPRFDRMPSATTKLPADRRGCPPLWGLSELRAAVAERLTNQGQAIDSADEVLITAGVAGAFNVALDAFVNPGDRVVLFDPTSPLYHFAVRQHRGRVRWLPSRVEKGRTRFDPTTLRQRLRGARMIVLTSPANPTGGMLHDEDLERIAWWADRYDVLIFDDTAFESYQYDGERCRIADQLRASRRTLTAGSVSKSHALTAARVGWLVGHRHLIRPCALAAALEGAFVPTLCQQLAFTALEQPDDSFTAIRTEYDARRHYLFERLRALGLQPVWPAGGLFIWLPVGELGLTGREFAERLLRTKKVVVWPGDYFGPSGTDYVRISYLEEDGRLRRGLSLLGDFIGELRSDGKPKASRAAEASRAA
jgi:aspartate/methionine/tyrosine aminotransferase